MLKVAYFSPLNPLESGIADYSEELLPHLAERMEIELFTDGYTPANKLIKEMFPAFSIYDFPARESIKKYDAAVYHIGNDVSCHEKIYKCALNYPGIVVMHDFALAHLIVNMTLAWGNRDAYLQEMEYCHGEAGRQRAQTFLKEGGASPWVTETMRYPLNRRIIESARGIICHNHFTGNRIKQIRPAVPVKRICHHSADIVEYPEDCRLVARRQLGMSEEETVLASFGHVTKAKRIEMIIGVLSRLCREGYRFKYYVIGGVAAEVDLEQIIGTHGFPRENIIITGYLELDNFTRYMKASDICFNLRYPVIGETSGSLHRLLGMGKAVLVSDNGSFREYPDNTVIKIDVSHAEEEQIYKSVKKLLDDPATREILGRSANRFARENLSTAGSAALYADFIQDICRGNLYFDGLMDELAGQLVELGFEEDHELLRSLAREVAIFKTADF